LAAGGLAELLLMCHHPAITAGVANKHATWDAACKRLRGNVAATLKGEQHLLPGGPSRQPGV
jgi:hypothetical protein